MSGIANPHGFHGTLEALGAVLVDRVVFRDHHPFTSDDRRRIARTAGGSGAEWIVTTEKDAVRLVPDDLGGVPILALGIGLEIGEGAEAVETALGLSVRGGGSA
jgi:tetraacyldisaccharide 4'-kinase